MYEDMDKSAKALPIGDIARHAAYGWVYYTEEMGWRWSETHPVDAGHCESALIAVAATALERQFFRQAMDALEDLGEYQAQCIALNEQLKKLAASVDELARRLINAGWTKDQVKKAPE